MDYCRQLILRRSINRHTRRSIFLGAIQYLHEKFIEKRDKDGNEEFVLFTETSSPFLQNKVFCYEKVGLKLSSPSPEEKRIEKAYSYFTKQLKNKIDSFTGVGDKRSEAIENYLKEVRDRILGLSVVFILLDSNEDAFQVFETLNTRGKDLDVSDLIKNYLSSVINSKNDQSDQVSQVWKRIGGLFSDSSSNIKISDFFLYYWLSFKGKSITKRSLFKNFKKTIRLKKDALDCLNSIISHAEIYRFLHEPDYIPENLSSKCATIDFLPVVNAIAGIKIFGVSMQMPLLISAFDKYEKGSMKLHQLIAIVELIEKFHFAYTAISGNRSRQGIADLYAETARKIRSAPDVSEVGVVISSFKKLLLTFYPERESFLLSFKDLAYSSKVNKNKLIVLYVLDKYTSKYIFEDTMPYDLSSMTIEHLLPQSSTGQISSSLGNLVLVTKDINGKKLGVKGLKAKVEILIGSIPQWKNDPFIEAVHKGDESYVWNDKDIMERSKHHGEIIYDNLLKV